jgi:CSLREA domain-containing protein
MVLYRAGPGGSIGNGEYRCIEPCISRCASGARPGYHRCEHIDDEDNEDGDCSLREAIKAASTNAAADECPAGGTLPDEIIFSIAGTIELNNQLLVTPGDPLIISAGRAITLDGGGEVRILTVFEGADLTLEDLSLINGYSGDTGGAINNFGTLTILSSSLSANLVADGDGGAVHNSGVLSIKNSIFSGNEASAAGGAIFNVLGAMLNVSEASFISNEARSGGHISNHGTLELNDSTLSDSLAFYGGGISNSANITVTNSTFSENVVHYGGGDFDGKGAGIMSFQGTVVISNTTFHANQAEEGAGINIYEGTLLIENSTFSGNQALGWGGHRKLAGSVILITALSSAILPRRTGSICGYSTFQIKNSIFAGSIEACDCYDIPCSTYFIDLGYNIEDANTCNSRLPTLARNWIQQLMPLGTRDHADACADVQQPCH